MSGYRKNYIRIYCWQAVSFLINFVALFIVTPLLSSTPEIFGIYSVCVGLNIFLQYADLGFLLAGKKYAAETIVKRDTIGEQRYVGTSMIILVSFSLLILIGILLCIFYPDIVIANISENKDNVLIARSLLLILCFSIPITILQKYVDFIYSLRLEEYKVQRALILGNLIRIISVPLYFFNDKYDIVGYYAFSQFITFLCCLFVLIKSKSIGYGVKSLFSVLKFHKPSFITMKDLAISGFGNTLSWVLFYEIDTIAISSLLGAKEVAIYAVGRTIQTFVRSLMGIVYGPYNVRFNYFKGNNDIEGMKSFFYVLTSFLSFTIAPVVALCFYARPFVLAWVGTGYDDSVIILQLLVLCYIFNSITNPCGSVVFAFNKTKEILKLSVFQPVFFWICVSFTIGIYGINSFAFLKFIACALIAFYWIHIAVKTLKINGFTLMLNNFVLPVFLSVISCFVIYKLSINSINIIGKSSIQLLCCIMWIGVASLISIVCYMIFYKSFRKFVFSIIKRK